MSCIDLLSALKSGTVRVIQALPHEALLRQAFANVGLSAESDEESMAVFFVQAECQSGQELGCSN